jgi:hypothetical protein
MGKPKTQRAMDYFRANPKATNRQARKALPGVSGRTLRRARQNLRLGIKCRAVKQARVLIFDLETSPMEVLVWGLYKQRISHENVIKEWACLSWAAKWLFEPEVMSDVVTPEEATARDDARIMHSLWDLINEADIIIAHNLKRFDERKMNARFILNELDPPLPYQTIDTLQHSRKLFAFSSHRLDFLNCLFDATRKIETNYSLWKRCINGGSEAEKALDEMVTYNRQDVVALEELYITLRPWMKSHPNMALYMEFDSMRCPNCGSKEITWQGEYVTPCGRYDSFRCECGAVGRSRFTNISRDERKKFGVSVAR